MTTGTDADRAMIYSPRLLTAALLTIAALPQIGVAQDPPPRMRSTGAQEECAYLGTAFREVKEGLLVVHVNSDAPAERAGLRRGDQVRSIDGSPATLMALDSMIRELEPGATVAFQVRRAGSDLTIGITTGRRRCPPAPGEALRGRLEGGHPNWPFPTREGDARERGLPRPDSTDRTGPPNFPWPSPSSPFRPDVAFSVGARSIAGVEVSILNPALAEYFSGAEGGLLVLDVVPETPGARGGLRPGDVITRAGGERVETIADLRGAIMRAESTVVPLVVVRKGREHELRLPLGRG